MEKEIEKEIRRMIEEERVKERRHPTSIRMRGDYHEEIERLVESSGLTRQAIIELCLASLPVVKKVLMGEARRKAGK